MDYYYLKEYLNTLDPNKIALLAKKYNIKEGTDNDLLWLLSINLYNSTIARMEKGFQDLPANLQWRISSKAEIDEPLTKEMAERRDLQYVYKPNLKMLFQHATKTGKYDKLVFALENDTLNMDVIDNLPGNELEAFRKTFKNAIKTKQMKFLNYFKNIPKYEPQDDWPFDYPDYPGLLIALDDPTAKNFIEKNFKDYKEFWLPRYIEANNRGTGPCEYYQWYIEILNYAELYERTTLIPMLKEMVEESKMDVKKYAQKDRRRLAGICNF